MTLVPEVAVTAVLEYFATQLLKNHKHITVLTEWQLYNNMFQTK